MNVKLSMQDVFNKVWNHFVVNDGPLSFVRRNGCFPACRYRGPKNAKCAIGVILPDEMYKPEMEDKTAARLLAEYDDVAALFELRSKDFINDPFVPFLTALQEAHDYTAMHGTNVQSLEEGFRKVAGDFRLIIPT